MAHPKELKFKPHVGHFFRFVERIRKNPRNTIMGKKVYGNEIKRRKKFTSESPIPQSVLVVDEKRNHVKFLGPDNEYWWTTKAQLEPIELPTYDGNPIPILQQYRDFLVYCTDTRIKNFDIKEMTSRAMDLLPKIDSMLETHRMKIIPK